MSEHTGEPIKARGWMKPMHARSQYEQHRASTPLELLFDLVFVIAVAQAASALLMLLTPFSGQPVLLTGLLLSALLAIKLVGRHRAGGWVSDAHMQKETA